LVFENPFSITLHKFLQQTINHEVIYPFLFTDLRIL
jgi:hypothetical protein